MMKKRKTISRILVWLCTIALCIGFIKIDTYAASSTLKITGKSEPANVTVGKAFDCKGTITSNFKLTNVTGKITTSSGSVKYQKSVNPSSKKAVYQYNLLGSAIDTSMLFNKLPVGSYKYIISAKDSSGKSLTLINKSFSVVKAASTLKISGATALTSLQQGKSWTCNGTISSNYNITQVYGAILKSDGITQVYKNTVKPNAKSFKLASSAIDKALLFNKLSAGTYYYVVDATDASGKKLNVVKNMFTVKGNTPAASTLKISGATALTSLQQGKSWTCNGTISSNYNITQVYGAILKSDGITQVYKNTVKPNAKNFKLAGSAVDTSLKFNKLSAGTYYYVVDATDASGKKLNVVKNKFTVQKNTNKIYSNPVPTATIIGKGSGDFQGIDKNGKQHRGIDFSAAEGSNIYALSDGVVEVQRINNKKDSSYGNLLVIRHTDGSGLYSLYAHMKDNSVSLKEGSKVKKGQVIGKVGNTGDTNKDKYGRGGYHLHLELATGRVPYKYLSDETLKYLVNPKDYINLP